MTWRPLLEGDERDRYREVIGEIARALEPHVVGRADLAAVFAYLGDVDWGTTVAPTALAERALEPAIAALANHHELGLWGGACGVGWAVAHLAEPDATTRSIDAVLARALAVERWPLRYDLISGLVGFGVYALECANAELATTVLSHLERLAEPRTAGLAWFTPPALLPAWQRALHPDGFDDFGVAHGIAGVIALCARYLESAVAPVRARRLLDGAVAYLRVAATPAAAGRYPSWSAARQPARVAWCYGDLGIAVAFVRAGLAIEDRALVAEGVALAVAAANRERTGVVDGGLCHGAAGIAHQCNRLWQATGDDALRQAARRWLDEVLAIRSPGDAIAGFPEVTIEDGRPRKHAAPGLIEGPAGVALCLLAATTDVEPLWDRLFLVDLPPG